MMTRDEFIEVVGELLEDYGYAYMNRQEARSVSIDSWARDAQERMDTAEDGLLAAYDEMTECIAELEAALDAAIKDRDWHSEQLDRRSERIAELEGERDAARAEAQARLESYNAEVDEFSAGFDAYRAGLSLDDQPEVVYDVWRVGYAWAAYDAQVERIAELEAACERALEGLRAPTHAANDHNCEDWPPGQGCRGCDGNELRKAVAGEIAALLRGER